MRRWRSQHVRSRVAVSFLAVLLLPGHRCPAQQNLEGRLSVTRASEPLVLLVRDPYVHRVMGVSPAQSEALRRLNDDLDPQLWSMRNQPASAAEETLEKVVQTTRSRLAEILSADQNQRLEQITLQVLSTRAFLADDLPRRLGLAATQRETIRDVVTQTRARVEELGRRHAEGEPLGQLLEEGLRLRADEKEKILATLDSDQERTWAALLGEPIDREQLGRIRFKMPTLIGDGGWVNSEPLTSEQLRGRVVVVHFYAFACGNCQRNFPWYRDWRDSFPPEHVVILGIHTPEIEKERDGANVRREARQAGLTFPILLDPEGRNWSAWGNSMWPSVYLVDKSGYARYWWFGELDWQGAGAQKVMKQRIEELVAEQPTAAAEQRGD